MKILVVDTYYPNFLRDFYSKNKKFKNYNDNLNALLSECFGTSDYYSYNLKKLGHEAQDLIVNDEKLQRLWAKENNFHLQNSKLLSKIQALPYVGKYFGGLTWIQEIAIAQIKTHKPDIVYLQDLSILLPDTLKLAKKYCKLLVGQIACPLPPKENLLQFDLILTSFPHFVKKFREMGIKSEYFKIGFETRLLKTIKKQKRIYPCVFIGSFSPHHIKGTRLLEKLYRHVPLHVWGQGMEYLPLNSPLRKNYHSKAWGKDMYKILAKSKIVINRHISVAGNNANNMRLYESTGMGAMLITDKKKNLKDLFVPNKEVVEYVSDEDLVKKVKYYTSHDKERQKIALSGQKRTIRVHSYQKRMQELITILNHHLAK